MWAARSLGLAHIEWRSNEAKAEQPERTPEPGDKREDGANKRKRRVARPSATRPSRPAGGEATSGDDLDLGAARAIDLEGSGGEEQLLESEIEQAFNQNFAQVRRCLALVASDHPVRGQLTFGLRIAGQKGVSRVNLKGPAEVTTGEAGDCLRKAARGLRLRRFDGPDMVVHYPLVLQ
jgi:hypothetical protein